VKSPTTHRRKRKLLEESQAKMFLDLVDVEQGVGVKESTRNMNNLNSSMLAIFYLKLIHHLCI
jgi:hypothetical protein